MTTPAPKSSELHAVVMRDPTERNIGEGTSAVPFTEEGKLLDLIINHGFADGPLTTAHLVPLKFEILNKQDGKKPYAGGVTVHGKSFTSNLYINSGDGTTLGVIIKKDDKYHVCSEKPIREGQAVNEKITDASKPLYVWYVIDVKHHTYDAALTIEVWTPEGYKPMYKTEAHVSVSDLKAGRKGTVSMKQVGGGYVSLMTQHLNPTAMSSITYEAIIAPGMDPLVVVAFVVTLSILTKVSDKAI